MIHTYRKVEYIGASRELKEQKRFYGQTWEKKKGWINQVTEEVASRCAEFPREFKVYDLESGSDSGFTAEWKARIIALEEYVKARKGGRPKTEES
jgi:hypothetical protein